MRNAYNSQNPSPLAMLTRVDGTWSPVAYGGNYIRDKSGLVGIGLACYSTGELPKSLLLGAGEWERKTQTPYQQLVDPNIRMLSLVTESSHQRWGTCGYMDVGL